MSVTVADAGLRIGEEIVPVYSGSVHYWRLERSRWSDILDRVRELGFGMIETYIPWSVHEIEPGVFDWGAIDDRKDIDAFMTSLRGERALAAGPAGTAHQRRTDVFRLSGMGDSRSRSPGPHRHRQSPYRRRLGSASAPPVSRASYASEAFYTAVGGWFDAICPIIARHIAPDGCVVSCQSDNETCYFFHDQAYATDYSPDSLALYRCFLADKYAVIADLNQAYGTTYPSYAEVEPPRDCGVETAADLPLHLDWVAYKEYQIIWAVARIARMLHERGITGIPIYHDIAFQEVTRSIPAAWRPIPISTGSA